MRRLTRFMTALFLSVPMLSLSVFAEEAGEELTVLAAPPTADYFLMAASLVASSVLSLILIRIAKILVRK